MKLIAFPYKGTWEELQQVNGEITEIEEEIEALKAQIILCEEHKVAISYAIMARMRRS